MNDFRSSEIGSILKDFKLPKVELRPLITTGILSDIEAMTDEINAQKERERELQEATYACLQKIEKNTSNLAEIMFLIKEGNISRDETYNLITEMMRISLAKDSDEAENIFRKVLSKANELKANAELLAFLATQGHAMINLFKKFT